MPKGGGSSETVVIQEGVKVQVRFDQDEYTVNKGDTIDIKVTSALNVTEVGYVYSASNLFFIDTYIYIIGVKDGVETQIARISTFLVGSRMYEIAPNHYDYFIFRMATRTTAHDDCDIHVRLTYTNGEQADGTVTVRIP